MEDLKELLLLLKTQTEEMGKDKPYLRDYIDGKRDAFNLILEYIERTK